MEKRFQMFTVLIAKAARCIRRIKTEEMAEFQLKSPHVSCLYYLYKTPALTAKELCDICDEDKANISRSVKYLEEQGYLYSHSKGQKRYQTPLELTLRGKEIAAQIAEKIDRVLQQVGEVLSEGDRAVFYRSLTLITDHLQGICDSYANEVPV